jgi:microcystin synthetase protein McyJ
MNDLTRAARSTGVVSLILKATNLSMLRRVIRQFCSSSPALYYEDLGYDMVENGRSATAGEHVTIWQNCGYWQENSTYEDACENLARTVAEAATLNESAATLDVGFGFGEQDLFWARHFKVRRIAGINISPFQVEFATSRLRDTGLSDRLSYLVGDAVNLDFADASFDRVIALQSAMHFNTRSDFFREAYRVLEPNGSLVMADMILKSGKRPRFSLWAAFTRRRVGWSSKNVYDAAEYERLLREAGFDSVEIEDISDNVFPGMREYITRRYRGEPSGRIRINASTADRVSGVGLWRFHYGVDSYVIVRATKGA